MKEKPPTVTPYEMPDFSKVISELSHGTINERLTAALAEVTAATEDTGKVGELTLKLTLKKEGMMVIVDADFKKKIPEHPMHATLFFTGDNGELLREDPRQLKLKGLDAPKLKTVKKDED